MSIWWALFFMTLGGLIVEFYNLRMWCRYREGKREMSEWFRGGK